MSARRIYLVWVALLACFALFAADRATASLGSLPGPQCTAARCIVVPYPYQPPPSRCVEGMWCWIPLLQGNHLGEIDVFWKDN